MTISDTVRVYLKGKPYTLEAIENGIVNYSALARQVQKELGIKNYQAVKVAIRRFASVRKSAKQSIEIRAVRVLRDNKITLLSGVYVIVSENDMNIPNDAKVKMEDYYVYLTRKNVLADMKKSEKDKLVKVHENCSAIILYSSETLENVSGVMAFIASLLAEQNINVVELISCYTETILVVNNEDAVRSYELLSSITK